MSFPDLPPLDAQSYAANHNLVERFPAIDALVAEMTYAALQVVPEAERITFMQASSDMLRELQHAAAANSGELRIEDVAELAREYSEGEGFQNAGVRIIPRALKEGGFAITTAVWDEDTFQYSLVHLSAGPDRNAMLSDVGWRQGTDVTGTPRANESHFEFQRRAHIMLVREVREHDAFTLARDAYTAAANAASLRTADLLGPQKPGIDTLRNLAYALVDGYDMTGRTYASWEAEGLSIPLEMACAIIDLDAKAETAATLSAMPEL